MTTKSSSNVIEKGNADEYTSFLLWIYDFFILKVITSLMWRCPTSKITLPFFRANVTSRHLDIGVGTGYFTTNGNIPSEGQLTLCDLNSNCLKMAEGRLGRLDVECRLLEHDVLEPLPKAVGKFDSISMLYLLHCLPRPSSRKAAIFSHLKHNLAPNGTMFGATVIGERRYHTGLSFWWLGRANRKGFMDNLEDNEQEFTQSLRENFRDVETQVVGAVFLFKASEPILQ